MSAGAPPAPARLPRALLGAAFAAGAVLTGLALSGLVAVSPPLAVAAFLALAGGVALLRLGHRVYWSALLLALCAYMFLGKGIAYVGSRPIFVAEIVLIIGLASLPACFLVGAMPRVPRHVVTLTAFTLFVAWQAARTFPMVGTYGLNALSDGVLWGYSGLAVIACLVVPRRSVEAAIRWYPALITLFLLWGPVAFVISKVIPLSLKWPGAPVPLIHLRSGDVGFQLAGIGAFLLLRLDERTGRWSPPRLWCAWALWVVNWICYGSSNRGASLAAIVGLLVVIALRPKSRWDRPLLTAAALLVAFLVSGIDISLEKSPQDVSFEQITENLESLAGRGDSDLETTVDWRLEWWRTVVDETVFGPYFWTGRGYGPHLGHVHRMETTDEGARAPHDIFVSVLARSGVPGLVLWVLFIGSLLLMLLHRARAGVAGEPWSRATATWLLAWISGLVFEASFGVIIEGPMGGVWFWSLVGAALIVFGGTPLEEPATPVTNPLVPAGPRR